MRNAIVERVCNGGSASFKYSEFFIVMLTKELPLYSQHRHISAT